MQFEHDIATSWRHQFRYLNPLLRFCGENRLHENDLKQVCQHAYETPEFWRFNYGYTTVNLTNIIVNTSGSLVISVTSILAEIFSNNE